MSDVKRYVQARNRDLHPIMRELTGNEFLTREQYVLATDYDALASRLAEAERKLKWLVANGDRFGTMADAMAAFCGCACSRCRRGAPCKMGAIATPPSPRATKAPKARKEKGRDESNH